MAHWLFISLYMCLRGLRALGILRSGNESCSSVEAWKLAHTLVHPNDLLVLTENEGMNGTQHFILVGIIKESCSFLVI